MENGGICTQAHHGVKGGHIVEAIEQHESSQQNARIDWSREKSNGVIVDQAVLSNDPTR